MIKEKNTTKLRYTAVFFALFTALFVAIIVNINTGNVKLSVGEIVKIIFSGGTSDVASSAIIWKIRLPRLITASLLGGALGVSGFLIQTFFRNPIASPFVLGISSGAKMMVAIAMVLIGSVSTLGMVAFSFVGSLISMGFVLLCSKKVGNMSMLLVVGIMIGYITSAVTDFVITFAKDNEIANLTTWSMGSFSSASWEAVAIIFAIVGVGTLAAFFVSKPIGAYQLGEGYAQSMGINVKATRTIIVLLTSLLSACVTAFAGPISFVGIAVPRVVKLVMKTSKPIVIIPASFLFGSVFCLFCDLIARTAFSPTEMGISTITAIFGAPIVIWMLLSKKRES
ncbi:MAG: iron ABC transporter permease [Clostridia bacterium]